MKKFRMILCLIAVVAIICSFAIPASAAGKVPIDKLSGDLKVVSVTSPYRAYYSGEDVIAYVTVQNVSARVASLPTTVTVTFGKFGEVEVDIPALRPGEKTTVEAGLPVAITGSLLKLVITAVVDAENELYESNEANNTGKTTVSVINHSGRKGSGKTDNGGNWITIPKPVVGIGGKK